MLSSLIIGSYAPVEVKVMSDSLTTSKMSGKGLNFMI